MNISILLILYMYISYIYLKCNHILCKFKSPSLSIYCTESECELQFFSSTSQKAWLISSSFFVKKIAAFFLEFKTMFWYTNYYMFTYWMNCRFILMARFNLCWLSANLGLNIRTCRILLVSALSLKRKEYLVWDFL